MGFWHIHAKTSRGIVSREQQQGYTEFEKKFCMLFLFVNYPSPKGNGLVTAQS